MYNECLSLLNYTHNYTRAAFTIILSNDHRTKYLLVLISLQLSRQKYI